MKTTGRQVQNKREEMFLYTAW